MTFIDLNTREEVTLGQEDVNIQGKTVVFTSEKLILNRKYNVVITAVNINDSAVSNISEISTVATKFICQHNILIILQAHMTSVMLTFSLIV